MKMSREEYAAYIKDMAKPSPLWKDMLKAFFVGGLICSVGEGISFALEQLSGLEEATRGTAVSVILVGLSALLTGLNVYDRLARFGGAGTLVPITGFANAVVSPALEFKSEGLVLGTAVKMFTIAGPVIVYGLSASVLYGLILTLL